MNKNRHRIVFNASRGQRMAVAEVAASHGGASRAPVAMAMAVFLLCAPTHAQVVADPNAPGHQRPTILQTGNGLPQINIQTPSAGGVSRNTFRQFDVQSKGAVINNSRTNTGTQLGGFIAGNPWLATGEARVILNEVNSSHPSHLNGYIEVAGRRAEVIIANPAGIQVNGGGFINASGVTLTTGTPVMIGGQLESFRVQAGSVRIDGLGLDASTADYTTILARTLEVNAALWAKELTVVTGSNDVKALATGAAAQATRIAGTGTAPVSMLDVAALGGMYAGKIYLVGTEAGLGVNNRGSLIAQEGEWALKADGSLINTGKLQAKGDLSIQVSGSLGNTGARALVSSQGHATLQAGGALDNTAGTLVADGSVRIAAAGIENTQGAMASAQSTLTIDSGAQSLANIEGRIEAAQDLTIATAALRNQEGLIQSSSALHIQSHGDLDNSQGAIVASGTLEVAAGNIDNSLGIVAAGGEARVTANGIHNNQGTIASEQRLQIDSAVLNNHLGHLQARNALDINTQGHLLTNTEGLLVAGGPLRLDAGEVNNIHQIAHARALQHAAVALPVLAQPHVLDAGGVGHDVAVRVVGEAGVFVFLVLRIQRHFHALAGEFTARERAQADDDLAHRFPAAFLETRTVVLLARCPGLDQEVQVVDQQFRGDVEELAAAVGVGRLAVHIVLKGAVARAGLAQVLAPQQELHRMPAGADVLFAAALVEPGQVGLGDLELGVVDQAGLGFALHVVHIGLVQRPGVDLAFGALVVVDRAAVEAERLGLAIELARGQPRLARGGQAIGRGRGGEGLYGGLHVLRSGQRVAVVGVHQRGVVRGHGGVAGGRGLRVGGGVQGQAKDGGGQGGLEVHGFSCEVARTDVRDTSGEYPKCE